MDNQIGFFYGLYVWFIGEHNLIDDSENITIAQLRNYCQDHIDEEHHQRYSEIIEKEELSKKTSYLETFYELATFIGSNEEHPYIEKITDKYGQGGLWTLTESLTDEFEEKYKDVAWGEELDWYDTLDEFLNQKLKTI